MLVNRYSQVNCSYWFSCLNILIQSLLHNETKCIVLVDININLSFPVITYDSKRELAEHFSDLRPDVYILDLDQLPVKESMKVITKCYNYNPKATFIVKTTNENFGFEEFSPRFIHRMIVITKKLPNRSQEHLNEKIGSDLENVYGDILLESLLKLNVVKKNTTLKFCHDLSVPYFMCTSLNCTEKSGLNFDVTAMIMEYLKFNAEFVLDSRVYSLEASEILLSGTCDVVLVDLGVSIDGGEVNFIYNVNDDYNRWIVPRAERVPKWKYLFEVFSIQLWLIWFSCLLVTCLVLGIFDYIFSFNKFATEPSTLKTLISQTVMIFLRKFYRTIRMFLEQTVKIKIYYMHNLLSLAISLFLIFMMNNLYKGRFTYLLLGTNRYPEKIKTFNDVLDKKMYLVSAHYRLHQLEELFPKIKNYPFFLSLDSKQWISYVAFKKDTAALKSTTETKFVHKNYLDEDGSSLIRSLNSVVTKILKGAVYLRGNPIFSDINKYVNKLRDHGFVDYILSKYEKVDLYVTGKSNKVPLIMTCHDLTGPIGLWLIGIFFAIFVFFLEWMKLKCLYNTVPPK
ncbi:hypothetical protein HHI36_006005 [Cryptolaemus montrouzieri]|uniref:Ionotropic receptor n=1 Tax=Cryptolaemus montrouzieri TaxID=559131 RepID=A0ABD2NVW5_9CUCU